MTKADDRLLRLLAERDAPAEDDAFVAMVMANVRPHVARAPILPAFIQPLAMIAPLVALAVMAPLLFDGLRVVLEESDLQVVALSLLLALGGWFALGAYRRTFGPVLVT